MTSEDSGHTTQHGSILSTCRIENDITAVCVVLDGVFTVCGSLDSSHDTAEGNSYTSRRISCVCHLSSVPVACHGCISLLNHSYNTTKRNAADNLGIHNFSMVFTT